MHLNSVQWLIYWLVMINRPIWTHIKNIQQEQFFTKSTTTGNRFAVGPWIRFCKCVLYCFYPWRLLSPRGIPLFFLNEMSCSKSYIVQEKNCASMFRLKKVSRWFFFPDLCKIFTSNRLVFKTLLLSPVCYALVGSIWSKKSRKYMKTEAFVDAFNSQTSSINLQPN